MRACMSDGNAPNAMPHTKIATSATGVIDAKVPMTSTATITSATEPISVDCGNLSPRVPASTRPRAPATP